MKFGYPLIVAALIATSVNWSLPASAQTGKETIDRLVQIFAQWSGSPKDRRAYDDAARYIDYQGMAERGLGSAEWEKLKAKQQSEFVTTLRTLIEQRYYTRWHRIFKKGQVSYLGESNSGGDTVVRTELKLGKKTDPLNWRLDMKDGEHKVVSLAVGQNDLLTRLSVRIKGRLDKYGFTGLLAWMKNKANIDPGNGYEEASSAAAN